MCNAVLGLILFRKNLKKSTTMHFSWTLAGMHMGRDLTKYKNLGNVTIFIAFMHPGQDRDRVAHLGMSGQR